MKIEDAIKERRSVRKYTDKVPPDELIKKVLEAGIWAPSGLNNQPWKFKVIKNEAERARLAAFTKYGDSIKSAPVAICVFLDNGATYNREKDIMAIGACIQNMLLTADALGLGAVWLGEILNRREEVERYLGISSDYEFMAVVAFGYPGEEGAKSSRKTLKSFIIK